MNDDYKITKGSVRKGDYVEIEMNNNKLETGFVTKILSCTTKGGTIVSLNNKQEGKVTYIFSEQEQKKESFKFWNKFIQSEKVFSIFDKEKGKFYELSRRNSKGEIEIVALLFNDYKDAQEFLENSSGLDCSRYAIKNAKRNTYIASCFPNAKYIRANIYRQIKMDKFIEMEYKLGR